MSLSSDHDDFSSQFAHHRLDESGNCITCKQKDDAFDLNFGKKDDRLSKMFELREKFMTSLKNIKQESYPSWPLDIKEKKSQQIVKNAALKGVEEIFEALQHLKNSKEHRQTEISEFNREEFIEEFVDAFNFFLASLILIGVTPEEFFDAYKKKDVIIHNRLKNGY